MASVFAARVWRRAGNRGPEGEGDAARRSSNHTRYDMLDTTTNQTAAVYPLLLTGAPTCAAAMSSASASPLAENTDHGTSKARPCLVLDIVSVAGERFAVLAYRTSAETPANRGYEIGVADPAHARSVGLHRPPRFVGARLTVSLKHPVVVKAVNAVEANAAQAEPSRWQARQTRTRPTTAHRRLGRARSTNSR